MKILQRVLFVLLAIVALLFVLLAGSIAIDFAIGRERINAVTNTNMPGADGQPAVRAYVARPEGRGPFPVVIMIHEFFGLNESIVGKAQGLAEEGYLVVAPDTFRGSTTAWIPRAIFQVITNKPEQINQDLDTVYAWIESQPDVAVDQTGIVGFCYGGRASLNYSLHNDQLAATVIFYGSPVTDPEVLQRLPGPVLGIFGEADNSIPVEIVRAFAAGLDQAGVPNQITIYEGQPHAFVTDIESIRSNDVQRQAWAQMLAFLHANLRAGGDSHHSNPILTGAEPFDWRYYLMLVYEHAVRSAAHSH